MSKREKEKLFALLGDRQAYVNLCARLGAGYRVSAESGGAPLAGAELRAIAKQAESAVLRYNEDFANPADSEPQDNDFIFPLFRALSAAITQPEMAGLVIDFSKPGLLEAAAPKLTGKAVSCNHWDYDVLDFYGVVSRSFFDPTGAETEGVPGINAELKISRRLAAKLVYGLLMEPPAVDAVSTKVFFTFEYSHPDLAEAGVFWRRMGEEINGQVVRLIAEEIVNFGRLSFVTVGADLYNRRLPDLVDDEEAEPLPSGGEKIAGDTGKKRKKKDYAGMSAPAITKGATVKLSAKQIAALGLQGQDGADFEDSLVLAGLDGLSERAQLGTQLLDALREKVRGAALRAAKLTQKGDGEVKLSNRDELLIKSANANDLEALLAEYDEQARASLTATCPQCQTQITSLRSSVDTQAGQGAPAVPRVNVV